MQNKLKIFVTVLAACLLLIFIFSCQTNTYNQGKILYENFCADCHGKDGAGLKALYPPVAGSDYLLKHIEEVPCYIKHGVSKPMVINGKTYEQPMAAIERLHEVEITNILNFILHQWYGGIRTVRNDEVQVWLQKCDR